MVQKMAVFSVDSVDRTQTSISTGDFNLRYTVYLTEIRKRLLYAGLSFLVAFVCAYTEKVALMYSITSSLQPAFSDGGENGAKQGFVTSLLQPELYNPTLSKADPLLGSVDNVSPPSSTLSLGEDSIPCAGAVQLIFTDVEEAFYTLFSVSFLSCFFVWFPVLVYHVLCFLQPGFYIFQSRFMWFSVCRCIVFFYGFLGLVDWFLIPRLLSFFYSFKIARSSLSLHAETKVFSYVSLYVSVYIISVVFLTVALLWGSYKRRQIWHWFNALLYNHTPNSPIKDSFPINELGARFSKDKFYTRVLARSQGLRHRKDHGLRGKMWWGCLLLAAFISPPEIASQLLCALFLIVWVEITLCLAYISSCRSWSKNYPSRF